MSLAGELEPQSFLAFDHRNMFDRLISKSFIPKEGQYAAIVCIKDLIYSATLDVVSNSQAKLPLFGILVDEKYAVNCALNAKVQKVPVALSIERNEEQNFTLEYGKFWKSHVTALNPDYIKVLINWSSNDNKSTIKLLLQVSQWASENKYGLLLEIIPELGKTNLLVSSARQLRMLGINPQFWKIPIPATIDEGREIVASAMAADSKVPKIFLLGGARSASVARSAILPFLSIPGISGWAVGRAIWGQAIENYIDGKFSEKKCIEAIKKELIMFLKIIQPIKTV